MTEILVVTDFKGLYEQINSYVNDGENSTSLLPSGRLVMDYLKDHDVDLVILDSQVGSMGGFAVAQEILLAADWGDIQHTKILLLLDRRADVYYAKYLSVDGFLIKPISAVKLRKAIKEILSDKSYYDATQMPMSIEGSELAKSQG